MVSYQLQDDARKQVERFLRGGTKRSRLRPARFAWRGRNRATCQPKAYLGRASLKQRAQTDGSRPNTKALALAQQVTPAASHCRSPSFSFFYSVLFFFLFFSFHEYYQRTAGQRQRSVRIVISIRHLNTSNLLKSPFLSDRALNEPAILKMERQFSHLQNLIF